MSLKNSGCVCYLPPVGEDLQVEDFGESVSYHSDSYLLSRINDLNISKNLQDAILSRFTEFKDSLSPELSEQFSKLSDDQKIDFTDSRYTQWLSDRKAKLSSLMKKFDEEKQKISDSQKAEELSGFEKSLRDLIRKYDNY